MSLGSRFWPSLYIISVTSPLHVCQYVTARYRTCTLRARFLVTKYTVDLRDRASEIRAACIQASSRAFQFAIRIDCIRFVMRIDSNRFVLLKNRPFDSVVVIQFFLAYLLYSLSQKNKLTSLFAAFNTRTFRTATKKQLRNAYYKNYS